MSDGPHDPDEHAARTRRATRWLSLLCAALVTHGSLYPWQFAMPTSFADGWDHMINQRSWWTGLGDVVGNVVLFVPVSVLGWALLRASRASLGARIAAVLGVGVAFAFVLQVAQIYVPRRDAALSDVVWNTVGLLLGLALAAPLLRLHGPRLSARALRLPLTFIVLWLLLQWWPIVPRLDWQHIKDALKPLLLYPRWRPTTAIDAALSLALLAMLLRPLRRRGALLIALPLVAGAGTLVLEHQYLNLSRTVGWLCGAVVGWQVWRLPRAAAAVLGASTALLWFTFDELRPFQFGESLGVFHWMPFAALLEGSLSANTLALTWQLFWLGVVIVLLHDIGAPANGLGVGLSVWALLLELTQILLPGRTADITPALLPWVWCMALPLLQVSLPGAVTKGMPRVQINPPRHAP
jgi:VanZ family protein